MIYLLLDTRSTKSNSRGGKGNAQADMHCASRETRVQIESSWERMAGNCGSLPGEPMDRTKSNGVTLY